jgi:heptosyltransferase-1
MTALLVVRPSSLGDVVHALAIVDDVVRARPDMAIDWVAERAFVELPALCPHVRHVHAIALRQWRKAPLRARSWHELRTFRREIRATRYDVVLDLQEQVKGGVVSRMARGERHGFDRASIREPLAALFDDVHHRVPRDAHFAMRCRMLAAAALGYDIDGPPRWSLAPPRTRRPETRYVVLLHATSRDTKFWPEDRWRALMTTFSHGGLAMLLPWGSEAERHRSVRLADGIDAARVPDRLSLTDLASLLAGAELVVGVDTGLTHLAAALGTPTLALFTATDPAGAGVAIAGAHARDLGGRGRVPTLADVRAAVAGLLRNAPRC